MLLLASLLLQAAVVGAKPNLDVILIASDETTSFFVRGEFVGKGRVVPLRIDKKETYEIRAEPDGCRSRSDTVSPPYRKGQEFRFQFMLGDCAPRVAVTDPVDGARLNTASVPVSLLVTAKDKLSDVRVSLNGAALQDVTDRLAVDLGKARPGRGGTWEWDMSFVVDLRVGPNTIKLEAVDSAGRTGASTIRVLRESQ